MVGKVNYANISIFGGNVGDIYAYKVKVITSQAPGQWKFFVIRPVIHLGDASDLREIKNRSFVGNPKDEHGALHFIFNGEED